MEGRRQFRTISAVRAAGARLAAGSGACHATRKKIMATVKMSDIEGMVDTPRSSPYEMNDQGKVPPQGATPVVRKDRHTVVAAGSGLGARRGVGAPEGF